MHSTRYAHIEGYTDICVTDDGRFLTAGEDGDVRIWKGFDDDESTSVRVGDKCHAIAYKNAKIYVADDLNEVKKYDLASGECEGLVTSFTLPVTSICISKSGDHLVCGSSDFEIHLVDLKTLKFNSFSGHEGPILHVSFDPLEKYFASTSCDGSVRFWSVSNGHVAKLLANMHPKSNDFNDSPCSAKLAWHKDGGLIAIPCLKEMHFYERETWRCKFKIELPGESGGQEFCASILCFLPDGQHILATTNSQMIYIHSLIDKSVCFKYSYTKKFKICSLVLVENEVIFCDSNGSMGSVKTKLSKQLQSHKSEEKKASNSAVDDELEMNELLDLLEKDETESVDTQIEAASKASVQEPTKTTSENQAKKRKRAEKEQKPSQSEADEDEFVSTNIEEEIDDQDEEYDDLESLETVKLKAFKTAKKEVAVSEDDALSEGTQTITSATGDSERQAYLLECKREASLIKLSNMMNSLQPAFQPSSTPTHLVERYMVWNSVGLISQFNRPDDETIDIEFHNATHHHTIHIKNCLGHTMADMSNEVIVLASPGSKEKAEPIPELADSVPPSRHVHSKKDAPSTLVGILVNAWDSTKEWSMPMPKHEHIRCVCASNSLVACATNHKFLRVFTLSGMQKELIMLTGAPIGLAAYENCIFACYHLSIGVMFTMNIGYSLFYLNENGELDGRQSEHGVISLSENASLKWFGFSDEGSPYYYDSNGFLFAKCSALPGSSVWSPISNLRANLSHKSQSYWVVGVAERKKSIKAILCSNNGFPQVLPRPTISLIAVHIPLISGVDSEAFQLEQDFWSNRHMSAITQSSERWSRNLELGQDDVDEMAADFESKSRETLMKLFMLACKSNKEHRAYEIATLMDLVSLQLAIKYATRTRALVLAQHLNILGERKAEADANRSKFVYEQGMGLNSTSLSFVNTSVCHERTRTESIENVSFSNTSQSQFRPPVPIANTQAASETLPTQPASLDLSLGSQACLTPTMIPLTNTRVNPFKVASASAGANLSSSSIKVSTPLADTSQSIINAIEAKINQQSITKSKDTWKPTSMKKLTKSKLAGDTPNTSISSFMTTKVN